MRKRNYWIIILLIVSSLIFGEDLLLDIMFTNDIHGGIDAYPATFINPNFPPILGGGGSAATYIKEVREQTDNKTRDNFLLDAGDIFQGHPIGTISKGVSVIQYMNLVGYDLSVVGNHEYDIGEEALIETYKHVEFPILSCNIVKKGTKELVDYVQPYVIIEKMGIRFGIIGVTTTDTKQMSFPENVKNVDFLPAKPELEKYIKIVQDKEVDIVIVVGHLGLPYYREETYVHRYLEKDNEKEKRRWGYDAQELAHEIEGIDIFFAGHMHKGFPEPWEDPITHTLVFQGWAYGSSIGHIIIKIDEETKTISGYELPAIREGVLITLFEEQFIPDEMIADTILTMQKVAEKGMDEIIGFATEQISKMDVDAQSKIGNLVCDGMLEATNADFSFLNLGGIRGELVKGPISYRSIFNVMPFDNQIVTIEVDGKFLKDIIEMRVSGSRHGLRVAGVEVVYNRKRKDYDRITKLLINGKPWKANKIYHITTSDFLLQGNAGLTMLTKIPEEKITRYEKSLRDCIVDYVKKNSPLKVQIDNRWERDDKSEISKELKNELDKNN